MPPLSTGTLREEGLGATAPIFGALMLVALMMV
jgi:hypothetical protein